MCWGERQILGVEVTEKWTVMDGLLVPRSVEIAGHGLLLRAMLWAVVLTQHWGSLLMPVVPDTFVDSWSLSCHL